MWGRKIWINPSEIWVLVFVLLQTSTVILSKSASFMGSQFPHRSNGDDGSIVSALQDLSREVREVIHMKRSKKPARDNSNNNGPLFRR